MRASAEAFLVVQRSVEQRADLGKKVGAPLRRFRARPRVALTLMEPLPLPLRLHPFRDVPVDPGDADLSPLQADGDGEQ
jgi:hypothetical protein